MISKGPAIIASKAAARLSELSLIRPVRGLPNSRMASTTRVPPAPWRTAFLEQISQVASPELVLSTLEPAASSAPTSHLPRARYCIYRGLWASLPPNDRNPAQHNPPAYTSDLPTITTDARMEKVAHLFDSALGQSTPAKAAPGSQTSGGGGPLEAVYWFKDAGAQWRMKGRGWIVAPDIDGDGPGAKEVKGQLEKYMRPSGGEDAASKSSAEWSWARELTAHFGNVSPGMRGSFRNPNPGAKVQGDPEHGHELGQKVEDLEDKLARDNFRVLIIEPEEAERLDLEDPSKARRWRWTLVGGQDGKEPMWMEEELWP